MPTDGKFTRALRFESPQRHDDGAGDTIVVWQEEFVVSADVFARMGSEAVLAARLTGIQPVEITVRRSDRTRRITSDWRAVDARSGEVFALVSPPADPDGKRATLRMLGRSGVAA